MALFDYNYQMLYKFSLLFKFLFPHGEVEQLALIVVQKKVGKAFC